MQKDNIDVMITGSQKAIACPPGISIVVLSKNALKESKILNVNACILISKTC